VTDVANAPESKPEKPSTNDRDLVARAVAASGLSIRQFALRIVGREPRTVRRWLAGQPIPKAARAFLEAYLKKRVRKPTTVEMKP
jgi:hypothetical protein